jgi:RNA ligase (TIGR02306 family)
VLATIETIKEVAPHPNADRLDIVRVLGYDAIVGRDAYKAGDRCVFIQPDTVLPVDREWAQESLKYLKGGNRLRAVRLRGEWSMGLVMPTGILGPLGNALAEDDPDGTEVSGILGVTKYEPPLPRDLKAKGNLPRGLPRTDEEGWQNLRHLYRLIGQPVDVTLKIDGSSFTAYCILPGPTDHAVLTGITSRSMDLELNLKEGANPWLEAAALTNVLPKLQGYCESHGVSLALRGEVYGHGMQAGAHNPHSKVSRGVAFYSVWNFDTREYEGRDSPHYYRRVCEALGLPEVHLFEVGSKLSAEMIKFYDTAAEVLPIPGFEGKVPFEGVVIKGADFSFKVRNKHYDSKK